MMQRKASISRHCERTDHLIWLFAFFIFLSIPPFYLWNISTIIYLITSLGFFFVELWRKPQNQSRIISLLLFIVFYIYASFNIYENLNLVGKLWNGFRLFIAFNIFFISDKNWEIIYKRFLTIYAVTLIPSLIVYFVVIWLGIDLPHTIISPLNELKDYNYKAYPFMVMDDNFDSYRFCGYYDEPGVIGNISGVLMIVNRCNMRDWKNWVLLLSGLFSFSLFFYVLISLYILFFGSIKIRISLFVIIGFAMTYLAASDNVFSKLILTRLEMGDDAEWIGDMRTYAYFDAFWNKYLHSDMVWFGYGHLYSNLVADTGGQSYKHLVVDHGIIMSTIYIVAFIFYYISYNINFKQFLFLIMILFSILFQRPFISYALYLFLMISPAAMVKYTFDNNS